MSSPYLLSGYDLTDEGPDRTVNEDATLVRKDLGLYAVADGAGGRGKGDVAAHLALRSIENYIGSTVRRAHESLDYDSLGTPNEAKRLSAALHQAHLNLLEVIRDDSKRVGMACTAVAAMLAPRTNQIHIAHVGDSRCYRMRHGRLELLTQDDTIANEVLELRPETPSEVLDRLPRNSVIRAVGMEEGFRVSVRSLDLTVGDQFLLCTDGLTRFVGTRAIWEVMREQDPPHVTASELLSLALGAHTKDNVSVLVIECSEEEIDEAIDTRRYAEGRGSPPSTPPVNSPSEAPPWGPDVLASGQIEAVEHWRADSEFPTRNMPNSGPAGIKRAFQEALLTEQGEQKKLVVEPKQQPGQADTYQVSLDDIEFDMDIEDGSPLSSQKS